MSSSTSLGLAGLVPLVAMVLLLLSPTYAATAATSLRGASEEAEEPPQQQEEFEGPRQLSELEEYAAKTGHLDPHIANGHVADDGGMVAPMYNSLGPSHVGTFGYDESNNVVWRIISHALLLLHKNSRHGWVI